MGERCMALVGPTVLSLAVFEVPNIIAFPTLNPRLSQISLQLCMILTVSSGMMDSAAGSRDTSDKEQGISDFQLPK